MDRGDLPGARRGDRKGKRAGRRARGIALLERNGYWHAHGTLRTGGRSVRVRKSLGLAVASVSQADAEHELELYVEDLKARASGKIGRGDPVAVAAEAYLALPRARPLGAYTVRIVKEIVARFGPRRLNEISAREWILWLDGGPGSVGRMAGRSAATRERHLNTILALLKFAQKKHGLAELPSIPRDRKARNPNRRKRRDVAELRPELVRILFEAAHISIRAQLATMRCTGARVSSVLYGVRICDLVLAGSRSRIIFRGTKSGEDVAAALDQTAVGILEQYLAWRGRLHDRQAPLFLTHRRKPYADNGRDGGGQNKTGFNAAKRRAIARVTAEASSAARALRRAGDREAARELLAGARNDAELLARVTQHWFRHRLATLLVRQDPRGAMEQGGWLDPRSLMAYAHDVPEHRAELVREADDLVADPRQDPARVDPPAAARALPAGKAR